MTRKKRYFSSSMLLNILKTVLALLLVWFMFTHTDLQQLFALSKRISLPWMVLGIFLYIILTLFKAMQYYFLIDHRVNYLQVLNIVVVQNAISNFIATGAGVASYLTLFSVEKGVKFSRATLAFVLTKVGDLISIWIFMLMTGLLIWSHVQALHGLIILLLTLLGVAIVLFFVAVILREKYITLLAWCMKHLKLFRIPFVIRISNLLTTLIQQDVSFIFRLIWKSVLFSFVYMTISMIYVYASLRTFSFEIGILPVVFANSLMQLVSYLPIQVFGGLGVNETTSLYLFGFFHVSEVELAAVLIVSRVLFYLENLIVLLYLPMYTLLFSRSSDSI